MTTFELRTSICGLSQARSRMARQVHIQTVSAYDQGMALRVRRVHSPPRASDLLRYVCRTDALVGTVCDAVQALVLGEDTYFIFASDHGEMPLGHQE